MDSEGRTFGFWAGGMVVYGACVVIVNLVLIKMTS